MATFQYAYRMIRAILWKSWRIRKHRKWQTLIEIAAPVLLVLLLVSVKAIVEPDASTADVTKPTLFAKDDTKGLISKLCNIGCTEGAKTSILAYAPDTPFINKLMKDVQDTLVQNGANLEVQGFPKEHEIEALGALLQMNPSGHFNRPTSLTGGVIFMSKANETSDLVYKIRLMASKFITGKTFPNIETPGPGKQFEEYESTGFLGLQIAIDRAFIGTVSPQPIHYQIETQTFPYPPYVQEDKSHYTMVLATLLPSAIIVGFSYMASISIKMVVVEKQSGVKQFLTMLGLSNSGYWFGWFLDAFCVALIAIFLIVAILTSKLSDDGAVLMSSSVSVVSVFLLLYSFAALWFCFFLTTLMHSPTYARSLGTVIWIGTFVIPAMMIGTKQRYLATQLLVSVFPNMCLFWGFNLIASWESRVIGVYWDNLEEYASSTDPFNFASIFAMLIFDGFFYMIVTILIHHREYSTRRLKAPYRLLYDVLYDDTKFPEFVHFLKKGCRYKRKQEAVDHDDPGRDVPLESPVGILRFKVLENLGLLYSENIGSTFTESSEPMKESGVKIRNLSKSFQVETVLQGISCEFYVNEISCILGDSGCGKTSLIKSLMGIVKVNEGTAYVNEYDIHDYLTNATRGVGFCPQQNILFYDLSVMENLVLFGWLRGKGWSEASVQARQIIYLLKLKDNERTPSGKLSKSSKRLLCCAIAMMGDPKVIILDGPTRDMDVETSTIFWNFLVKSKVGKMIIFTSKSVDEAAMMADRIAIVHDGRLRCIGSPQYLRSILDDGFSIKLSVTAAAAGAEKVVRMISQEMKFAEVKDRTLTTGREDIALIVPEMYGPLFPKIFFQVYENKEEFGIQSVHIDSISVDDIFHSVHEMREFKHPELPQPTVSETVLQETTGLSFFVGRKLTGFKLAMSRMRILILKKYWMTRMDLPTLLLQVLMPLVLILSGITGANRGLRNTDNERFGYINIGLSDFKNPVTLFKISDPKFESAYINAVGSSATSSRTRIFRRLYFKSELKLHQNTDINMLWVQWKAKGR